MLDLTERQIDEMDEPELREHAGIAARLLQWSSLRQYLMQVMRDLIKQAIKQAQKGKTK